MAYFRNILILFALCLTTGAQADKQCPDFALPSMEGPRFVLKDKLTEGPVLIDFWATWCKPCVQELPELEKITKEFGPKGLQVVAISIDNPRSQAKVRPFIRGSGYSFDVLLDGDLRVRKMFGGTSVPLTLLVSQAGEILYQHLGYLPGDEVELREAVKQLFAEADSVEVSKESE